VWREAEEGCWRLSGTQCQGFRSSRSGRSPAISAARSQRVRGKRWAGMSMSATCWAATQRQSSKFTEVLSSAVEEEENDQADRQDGQGHCRGEESKQRRAQHAQWASAAEGERHSGCDKQRKNKGKQAVTSSTLGEFGFRLGIGPVA
jgi:hypothetical protein